MIQDSVPLSQIRARYEQLAGANGFDNNWYMGAQFFKSGIEKTVLKIIPIKEQKKTVEKLPDVDKTFTVQLGGEFEKIGGEDEVIGERNQKVGSRD